MSGFVQSTHTSVGSVLSSTVTIPQQLTPVHGSVTVTLNWARAVVVCISSKSTSKQVKQPTSPSNISWAVISKSQFVFAVIVNASLHVKACVAGVKSSRVTV